MAFPVGPLIAAALTWWAPVTLAALGGVVSERAGVVNIGLEGMMLAGAYVSVATAQATGGNVLLGLASGVLAGAIVGLLHAVFTQALRVPHILSGVGLNLGVLGVTTYAYRLHEGAGVESPRQIPGSALIIVAAVLVAALWFVLARTPLGLRLRALGENPGAVRSAGINIAALRYGAVTVSGALAGLGGVALALTDLHTFTENMTSGRGYIALAAVIFGRWNPLGAAGAALFFALGDALQQALQTAGSPIPPDLIQLLPYVLTLVALAGASGKNAAPAALGDTDA